MDDMAATVTDAMARTRQTAAMRRNWLRRRCSSAPWWTVVVRPLHRFRSSIKRGCLRAQPPMEASGEIVEITEEARRQKRLDMFRQVAGERIGRLNLAWIDFETKGVDPAGFCAKATP